MQNDLAGNGWQTLRFSPFWVRCALAGRYRQFHPLEDAAFWRCMNRAAFDATGVARDVFMSVVTDRDRAVLEFDQDGRPVGSGLRAVVAVLATLPSDESAHFKDVLFAQLATGLARARGPFGNAVSGEDAETLALLAELLERETGELNPLDLPTPV